MIFTFSYYCCVLNTLEHNGVKWPLSYAHKCCGRNPDMEHQGWLASILHNIGGPHCEDSTTRVAQWLGTRSPGNICIHMSGGSYWLLARTLAALSAGYLYWPHLHWLSMWLPCVGCFELPHHMEAGFPEQGRSANDRFIICPWKSLVPFSPYSLLRQSQRGGDIDFIGGVWTLHLN